MHVVFVLIHLRVVLAVDPCRAVHQEGMRLQNVKLPALRGSLRSLQNQDPILDSRELYSKLSVIADAAVGEDAEDSGSTEFDSPMHSPHQTKASHDGPSLAPAPHWSELVVFQAESSLAPVQEGHLDPVPHATSSSASQHGVDAVDVTGIPSDTSQIS